MNILFVSLGNVCRSPIAEALLKKKYQDHNITDLVDSAGFESFHINDPPDPRAKKVAQKHGIILDRKARLFLKSDFDTFDKIYVMDTLNYTDVKELARNKKDVAKIDYLMNLIHPGKNENLPEPFMHGIKDCNEIFQILDAATDMILNKVMNNN